MSQTMRWAGCKAGCGECFALGFCSFAGWLAQAAAPRLGKCKVAAGCFWFDFWLLQLCSNHNVQQPG